MNETEILKDAAAANAAICDELIAELTAALAKVTEARNTFVRASTWTEFDDALQSMRDAAPHLPADAISGIVNDPT